MKRRLDTEAVKARFPRLIFQRSFRVVSAYFKGVGTREALLFEKLLRAFRVAVCGCQSRRFETASKSRPEFVKRYFLARGCWKKILFPFGKGGAAAGAAREERARDRGRNAPVRARGDARGVWAVASRGERALEAARRERGRRSHARLAASRFSIFGLFWFLRVGETFVGLWTMESVLKSHGPLRVLLELSIG